MLVFLLPEMQSFIPSSLTTLFIREILNCVHSLADPATSWAIFSAGASRRAFTLYLQKLEPSPTWIFNASFATGHPPPLHHPHPFQPVAHTRQNPRLDSARVELLRMTRTSSHPGAPNQARLPLYVPCKPPSTSCLYKPLQSLWLSLFKIRSRTRKYQTYSLHCTLPSLIDKNSEN